MMSGDNKNTISRRNDSSSSLLSWWDQAKLDHSSSSLPRSTLAMSMMRILLENDCYVPDNENYYENYGFDFDYDDDENAEESKKYNHTIKGIIVEFKSNTDIIWFACERFPIWTNFILADTSVELRDNESFMIELSKLFGNNDKKKDQNTSLRLDTIVFPPFMHASNRLKTSQEFVINTLRPVLSRQCHNSSSVARRNFEYIDSSSPNFLDDVNFVNEAFGWTECVLEYATTDVINNTELWKQLFRNYKDLSYFTFQHVPERFWFDVLNNTEFWKQLFMMDHDAETIAKHVPERVWDEIRGDPEIMLSAIVHNDIYTDLLLNSARVLNDKEFICQLVQINNYDIVHCYFENHASDYPAFLDDEDIMSAAVSNFPRTFKYASLRLIGVRKLVLEAVRSDPSLIGEVPSDLRYDKEVALQAVRSDGYAIQYFQDEDDDDELKNDIDLAVAAVQQNGNVLRVLCDDFQNNRKVVLAAVQGKGCAIRYASPSLQNDIELATEAVQQDGMALEYVPQDLQNNKDVVLNAVKKAGRAIQYASPSLQNGIELATEAVQQDGWFAWDWLSDELQYDAQLKVLAAATSKMKEIKLPKLDLLSNLKQLPFFLEKATNHPLVMYYILLDKNNLLLPPSSAVVPPPQRSNKRKRGDN